MSYVTQIKWNYIFFINMSSIKVKIKATIPSYSLCQYMYMWPTFLQFILVAWMSEEQLWCLITHPCLSQASIFNNGMHHTWEWWGGRLSVISPWSSAFLDILHRGKWQTIIELMEHKSRQDFFWTHLSCYCCCKWHDFWEYIFFGGIFL